MEKLTRREMQVAELLAWGANRKEIPDMLRKLYGSKATSVNTINNITANIYAKLNINSGAELSAWYFCEVQGVDSSLSPLKRLRETIYAVIFLAILTPQLFNLDQALRPNSRTQRVEEVMRARRTGRSKRAREDDNNYDLYGNF